MGPGRAAVVARSLWEDSLRLGRSLVAWLAGPSPSTADRLRAVAAMEVLGVALTSATYGIEEVTDEQLRRVLPRAAMDVLRSPGEPDESGMRNVG